MAATRGASKWKWSPITFPDWLSIIKKNVDAWHLELELKGLFSSPVRLAVDHTAGFAHATLLRFTITDDKTEVRVDDIKALSLYLTLKSKAPTLIRKIAVATAAEASVKADKQKPQVHNGCPQRKANFEAAFSEAHGHYEAQLLHNEALVVTWKNSKLICAIWILVHNVETVEVINNPLKYAPAPVAVDKQRARDKTSSETPTKKKTDSAASVKAPRRLSLESTTSQDVASQADEELPKFETDPYAFRPDKDVIDFTFNFSLFGGDNEANSRIYTYTFMDVFTKKESIERDYVKFTLIKAERAELQQATERELAFMPTISSLAFSMKFPMLSFYSLTVLNCRKIPICRTGGPIVFGAESSEFRSANFDTLGDDFLAAQIDCGDAKIDVHLGSELSRNKRNKRYVINRLFISISTALLEQFGI